MFKPNYEDKNHPNDFRIKKIKRACKGCRKFNKHNNKIGFTVIQLRNDFSDKY